PHVLTDAYHFFFFTDTPTTKLSTLSLHDALPILQDRPDVQARQIPEPRPSIRTPGRQRLAIGGEQEPTRCIRQDRPELAARRIPDRKSTRLNSSHVAISYAVFCLKKKKDQTRQQN